VAIFLVGFRNVLRNRLRTLLTVMAVAVTIVAFLLFRTVVDSWTAGADHAAKDRIGTRHKITFVMTMPLRYVEEVRQIPGIKAAAQFNWFGGKYPKNEDVFFGSMATVPKDFLEVYDEILVSPEQREAWFQDRRGALVGDALANQLKWKVGDKVTLQGTIYQGNWDFTIDGIYTATRRSVDRASFYFHYDYLNELQNGPMKDRVGWIASRIDDAGRSAQIAKSVDQHFENNDIQTLSMSERALQTGFLGMISAILKAVDLVSVVILVIMMLIVGNTIAMGVRERTSEYGTLRAIGFLPKHLAGFVLGEAAAVGGLGGIVGLVLGYPLVEKGLGRFLEENMGGFFPFFRVNPTTALVAFGLAVALGLAAAIVPARQASQLNVIDALRRVG
jgi:putative ABC transport system permease protein